MSSRPRVGMYELGRTLGEGRFAKVKFGKHKETGEAVAIKIIEKDRISKADKLIRREISTMKLIKHPHVVRLLEVLATKKKVYMILEYADGGELFDRIVESGKLSEDEARKYFRQLIRAVDYCHSRGVFHRDLKPENLLLSWNGDLKITDFGLSALSQQQRDDGLFHTTCGTPNYVAPEVMDEKGYEGAPADLWSCGIILYVFLAGSLPFNDSNLSTLYQKMHVAKVNFRPSFPLGPQKLIRRLLDPNPKTRATVSEICEDEWFQLGEQPLENSEERDIGLKDGDDFLDTLEDVIVKDSRPVLMNAFDIISKLSQGLDLSNLFTEKNECKIETKFTSMHPAREIMDKIENFASTHGYGVRKRNYKMKMQSTRPGRMGRLGVAIEVFEVSPAFFMIDVKKTNGDSLEYKDFQKQLSIGLKEIVWKTEEDMLSI